MFVALEVISVFLVYPGFTYGGGIGWERARDRWEYSHALRAILSGIALLAQTIAAARQFP